MKNIYNTFFSVMIASAISFTATAQKDTTSYKTFKDIYKNQETDPHLETEIKKKELQQVPSQLVVFNDDSSALKKTKKYKCRKKKNTGI